MMLPLKTGLIAAAASAFMFAAPVAPAAAAPMGVAPNALVRADPPIDQVRYRRHAVRHGHHATRYRHYAPRRYHVRRHYRYGYNPGVAVLGTVLGAVAAANAYDYYDPGYYPYAYPAYSYPAYGYGYGYPAYYGYGWGGRRVIHGGHWGWGGGRAIHPGGWGGGAIHVGRGGWRR
ncbi:MAG TPA: hypothetical protein PKA55_17355 [Rhodoblastus sp.]|nr:hypothetical protein [Rhodoblastus sp.]